MIFFIKTKSGSYRIEADNFKEAEAKFSEKYSDHIDKILKLSNGSKIKH